MVDLELRGLDGSKMDAAVQAGRKEPAGATISPAEAKSLATTWGDLQIRHPDHRPTFWEECRALYAGGPRLLENDAVMTRLFPANLYEDDEVYKERRRRAHYFPYPGAILDKMIAGLGSDPLRVSFAEANPETGALSTPPAAEWWEQWVGDVTGEAEECDEPDAASDESGVGLHEFMATVSREALQVRRAWVLCEIVDEEDEIGAAPTEIPPADAKTDPTLRLIPAENVIDWHETKRKDLEWVLTLETRLVRSKLSARRSLVEQTYTLWTSTEWVRYVVQLDPTKPPDPDHKIAPTLTGSHAFGCVPFLRIELPEGMWGMGKMHSLAREHLNKRCAVGWAEYKSLFPILYEFQGSEESNGMPVPVAQRDANRSTNQTRGIGYSQIRGKDDRAEFIGPPTEAFAAARESCSDVMREMHRVMHSMAQSADMDSAALQRSGESKSEDNSDTEVILDFLGLWIRQSVRRALAMVARGRTEPLPARHVAGLSHFDIQGVSDAISEVTALFAGVPIKSARFAELVLANLYAKVTGDGASQADREKMREQLAEQLSAEEMLADAQGMNAQATADNGGVDPNDPNPDEGDDPNGDSEDTGEDPPTTKPPGPMISSKRTKKK